MGSAAPEVDGPGAETVGPRMGFCGDIEFTGGQGGLVASSYQLPPSSSSATHPEESGQVRVDSISVP